MRYELKTVYSPDDVQAGDRVEVDSPVRGGVLTGDLMFMAPVTAREAETWRGIPSPAVGTRAWRLTLHSGPTSPWVAKRVGLVGGVIVSPASFPAGRVRVRRRPPESLSTPVAVTKRKPVRA